MAERKTLAQFIEEAKFTHNNKYDYSKVEYINKKTKVCIICPIHGEFWQTPANHLHGKGCPKCKSDKLKTCNRKSLEEFILAAKLVHGDKYDYSKVEYINNKTKVCIICPEHGEFWQKPNNHLQGQGCSICSQKKQLTTEDFIKKSRQVHGDKYDYSKVNYINNRIKVCIICPEHGEFWQKPNDHLNNHGCPKCGESKGEKEIKSFLVENNIKYETQKTFETCKNKKLLPFDFYLPDYNLCIEFQGKQHYIPMNCFGGKEKLDKQTFTDNIKRDWCSKLENPNLLEIKYDEDIKTLLIKNIWQKEKQLNNL